MYTRQEFKCRKFLKSFVCTKKVSAKTQVCLSFFEIFSHIHKKRFKNNSDLNAKLMAVHFTDVSMDIVI